MLTEGALLLERAARRRSGPAPHAAAPLRDAVIGLRDVHAPGAGPARCGHLARRARRARRRPAARHGHRERRPPAPRPARARAVRRLVRVLPALGGRDVTTGTEAWTSGTLRTAAARLPAHRRHGLRRRLPDARAPDRHHVPQGPQQLPRPAPGRPGLAVRDRVAGRRPRRHPPRPRHLRRLGRLRRRGAPRGLEVALDLALQCSPDHPWVTEHPEWFTTRADGTIAYAENPPKKYQDIYPLNFDNDPEGIYAEVSAA